MIRKGFLFTTNNNVLAQVLTVLVGLFFLLVEWGRGKIALKMKQEKKQFEDENT